MTSHGWLAARTDIIRDDSWFGVHLQPDLSTRWEEFTLARGVAAALTTSRAWDAGTGVTPHQHILPMILGPMGWLVVAQDKNPETLGLPHHPNVVRVVGNMTKPYFANESFDAIFCISTLEHMEPEQRVEFLVQANRTLKRGGILCLTMDELDPRWFVKILDTFDCGEYVDTDTHLSPRVSYVIARKG